MLMWGVLGYGKILRFAPHLLTLSLGFHLLRHTDGPSLARLHFYHSMVVN